MNESFANNSQKEERKTTNSNIKRPSMHISIDANKPLNYPDLENSKIKDQNLFKVNRVKESKTNNLFENKSQNGPIKPIIVTKNLEQAPTFKTPQNYSEESSFDCQLSEEDLKKKIQKFIEEERDQKDFYLENSNDKIYNELREKEEKALKSIFTSFKKDYLNEIELKYKQEFSQLKIDFNSISEKIIIHENGEKILEDKIKKNIIEIEQNNDKFSVKHITILLVGKSGVGKSTLCNNILRLPEDKKAMTDIGKPVTQKSKIYTNHNVNFLKVIDTAGIEIHGENKIENVIKNCKETIDYQVSLKDNNDMVSCIFYCFTGSRIEDEEVEFLDELRKSLKGNYIPILYVYTQAVRQSAINGMKECIEKERTRLGDVEFVPILAEDYDLIDNKYLKSYGLDIILEKAVNTIKKNIKSNLFEIRTKEISDKIVEDFKEKNKKIRMFSIEKMYLYFIEQLGKTLNKEQLMNFLFEILEKCFIFFLEPKEKINLNKNSIEEYKISFQSYIEKCYELFDETSSNIIEKFKYKQAGTFINEQAKIEKRGKSINPDNIREYDQFIKNIDDYCRSNFNYIAQKAFIKHFINEIYEKICESNEKNCNEKIKSLIDKENSIKVAVNNCFITKYRNIEKNIEEYKKKLEINVFERTYV